MQQKSIFLKEPADHDFPAAQDYLELIMPIKEAIKVVEDLRKAHTIIKK